MILVSAHFTGEQGSHLSCLLKGACVITLNFLRQMPLICSKQTKPVRNGLIAQQRNLEVSRGEHDLTSTLILFHS